MINVVVTKYDDALNRLPDPILKIEIKGHAGSGPYGHDLACAAVSAIIVGTANQIEEYTNQNEKQFNIEIKEGYAVIEVNKDNVNPCYLDPIYYSFILMLTQLKTIQASYPKLINIKEEKTTKF